MAEARDEPGALPLVENALHWLWEQRSGQPPERPAVHRPGRARRHPQRQRRRPARRPRPAARAGAGAAVPAGQGRPGGPAPHPPADAARRGRGGRRRRRGRAGPWSTASPASARWTAAQAQGPLRLITVTEEAEGAGRAGADGRWVNLIHETLIRSKGLDAQGKPQPYWPTLWTYIEQNKDRAARRERLQLLAREWKERRGLGRLFGLAGWPALFGFRGLAAPGSVEQRYLRWSRARAAVQAVAAGGGRWASSARACTGRRRDELPLEAVVERWAYMLGKELPFPSSRSTDPSPGSFEMGSRRRQRRRATAPIR